MVSYIHLLAGVMSGGDRGRRVQPLTHGFGHALVGLSFLVFEWIISRESYPLISKLETVLEIFLGRGASSGKER